MDCENMTYSEMTAAADYAEARMYFNNDLHGQPEPPAKKTRDEKLALIEKILGDTQGKPRNPSDEYFLECGLFYR